MPDELITLRDTNNIDLYSLEDEAAYLLAMKQNRDYSNNDAPDSDEEEVKSLPMIYGLFTYIKIF